MRAQRTLVRVLTAALAATALTGCGSFSSIGPGSNTISLVRVFHGLNNVPGANGAIDVALRQPVPPFLAAGIAFGQTTNGYLAPPAGNGVNVYAFQTGQATALVSGQVMLDPHTTGTTNGVFTLAFTGVVGGAAGTPQAPQVIRLIDNFPVAVQLGNSSAVRLVNLAPGSPPITLYNQPAAGGLVPISGLTNVAFGSTPSSGTISGTNYAQLAPATYHFVVGDSAGNNLGSVSYQLQTAVAYTVFVYGVFTPPAGSTQLGVTIVADVLPPGG